MGLPRVLHVFSTFDPGGPEVRTAKLIDATQDCFLHYVIAMDGRYGALSRIGQDTRVEILPRPPIVPQDIAELATPIRLPAVLWRLIRNAIWVRNRIRDVQPDLILTYNLGAASALLAARTVRTCPIIHTETGFSAEESARPKPARVFMRQLVAKNVSALVVPSRALELVAQTAFRLRTSIIRIPNGVDVRKFKPADSGVVRRQLGVQPTEFVIGCVGHLRPEKGHERLLKAFQEAAIPNSKLLLLGDGPMRPILEKACADMRIASRVVFVGSVHDVVPYYAAMDVFALASDTEQMPMGLLEAMACGLPVVCTDVGDCREIVGDQLVPVIFAVDDIAGFAEALRIFSRDENLRTETGKRNRRRCVEDYDSDRMLTRYRELYLRMIDGEDAQLS